MKLVDDARQAWRWFSIWALGALGALPVIWTQIPPESQALIPPEWRPWVLLVIALAGIAGRTIKQ